MDLLTILPPEIILRVLDFAPIASLACLTRLSKAWHDFIEETHQDSIYSSGSKTSHPVGAHDFDFLKDTKSFAKYYDGTASWKDLCKRQTLLQRKWDAKQPVTKESVVHVRNGPVWRFRPDFKRRFFVSTSQAGGLDVTDMDTGNLLWQRPSTLDQRHESVGPYAHLEYQDGTAVWNQEGNALEVWKTGLEGLARGEFCQVAVLPHECQTRGFQLSYNRLCVVSSEGQGFVYDMEASPPQLTTHLKIGQGAVGHLDQNQDVVMYSMGTAGYDLYDKTSGEHLGSLAPSLCSNMHHIMTPVSSTPPAIETRYGPTPRLFPRAAQSRERLEPIDLRNGPLPREHWSRFRAAEDEWGAGMLSGNLMVGISRRNSIFVCWNWRSALKGEIGIYSAMIECESAAHGSHFDMGGWLSVKDNRILVEVPLCVYVLALDSDGRLQDLQHPKRASYSFFTSSAPQLSSPVSFMVLYDDCIMTTYCVRS